ncbi:MAG: hypothetical protein EKK64_02910 [Neisseriaceae bacterium]|nr:MAG: hypothetical protein EKK64_02910 [Neisseriaceae bacterium]
MENQVLLSEDYALIIDTNKESLDFCCELCSYCTGMISEGEVDLKYSDAFYEDLKFSQNYNPFAGYCMDKLDENGDYSPCSVWLNKKYGIDENGNSAELNEENYSSYEYPAPFSVGIFFCKKPTQQQIEIIKERANKFFLEMYNEQSVKVEKVYLIKYTKYAEEQLI